MREFIDSIDPFYSRAAVFIIVSVLLYTSSKKILNKFYPMLQEQNKWYFTKKIVMNTIYLIIFLIFLFTFSDRVSGIYTTLGLAGAGITFALREVIVSFAGWFAILFGDFFKVGDRVLLGGIKGDVIDLGVLRTTLMEIGVWVDGDQYNGRIVRVANSFIFTSPVHNYSAYFNFIWDEMHLRFKFGSDAELIETVLGDIAAEVLGDVPDQATEAWFLMRRKFRLENATLEPQVFMKFEEKWMEFSLRYVVEIRDRRKVSNKIFFRLLKEIKKYEGRIVLESETIELVNTESVKPEYQ